MSTDILNSSHLNENALQDEAKSVQPRSPDPRRILGARAEQWAAGYLEKQGYVILMLNYRVRYGEVDIIALDRDVLVFCEVKARRSLRFGSPAEAITQQKQDRLAHLAEYYVATHPELAHHPIRFDAVLLLKQNQHWSVQVLVDAFRPGW